MNKLRLIFTLLVAGIYSTVLAAPPDKPPPAPQDVNVVNTPDVNIVNTPNVTVTNPATSVTVDNSASNPVPVTVQGGVTVATEPRFVGFSDTAVQGGVGLVGMHGACRDTFGSGARMCLTIEVFKTPDLEAITLPVFDRGWVAPQILDIGSLAGGTYHCYGWTSSVGQGITLFASTMAIAQADCSIAYPVACCQ